MTNILILPISHKTQNERIIFYVRRINFIQPIESTLEKDTLEKTKTQQMQQRLEELEQVREK